MRGIRYSIIEHAVKDTSFFTVAHDGERLVLVLNPDHPFYREIYKPLSEGETPRDPAAPREARTAPPRGCAERGGRAGQGARRSRSIGWSGATRWPRS